MHAVSLCKERSCSKENNKWKLLSEFLPREKPNYTWPLNQRSTKATHAITWKPIWTLTCWRFRSVKFFHRSNLSWPKNFIVKPEPKAIIASKQPAEQNKTNLFRDFFNTKSEMAINETENDIFTYPSRRGNGVMRNRFQPSRSKPLALKQFRSHVIYKRRFAKNFINKRPKFYLSGFCDPEKAPKSKICLLNKSASVFPSRVYFPIV